MLMYNTFIIEIVSVVFLDEVHDYNDGSKSRSTTKQQHLQTSKKSGDPLSNSKYVDFLVLGFKGTRKFKSVDDVLLGSSLHHCLQNAQTSLVVVKNRFDARAFAKHLSVTEVIAQRRFQKYLFSSSFIFSFLIVIAIRCVLVSFCIRSVLFLHNSVTMNVNVLLLVER